MAAGSGAEAAGEQGSGGAGCEAYFDTEPTIVLEEPEEEDLGWRVEPVPALTPPSFLPPPPKAIDLDEARPVMPMSDATAHADRRSSRARRIPPVPPSRRPHRPGRRPER